MLGCASFCFNLKGIALGREGERERGKKAGGKREEGREKLSGLLPAATKPVLVPLVLHLYNGENASCLFVSEMSEHPFNGAQCRTSWASRQYLYPLFY